MQTFVLAGNSPLAEPGYQASLAPGSSLPPGLALLAGPTQPDWSVGWSAGVIAGMPSQPGTWTFSLEVRDKAGNTGRGTFSIRVSPVLVLTRSLSSTRSDFTVGKPFSRQLEAAGGAGPYRWTADAGLPPGLSLAEETGLLSGRPTTSGQYQFRASVKDSNGESADAEYTVRVSELSIETAALLPMALPGQPYSVQMTSNVTGVTWSMSGAPAFLSLDPATGLLSGVPKVPRVQARDDVQYFDVTVSRGSDQFTKQVALYVRHPIDAGRINTGIGLIWDLSLRRLVSPSLTFMLLRGGTPPWTVRVTDGALPPGVALCSDRDCPEAISPGEWGLRGAPTAIGHYEFALEFRDSAGLSTERHFSMNVTPPFALAQSWLGTFRVGSPGEKQLTVVGGVPPYRFAPPGEPLPVGLTLTESGMLQGTPLTTGGYWGAPPVVDASGNRFYAGFTFNLDGGPSALLSFRRYPDVGGQSWPYPASLGMYYWANFTPSGGTPPYEWSVEPGFRLPPGLLLRSGTLLPGGFESGSALIDGVPETAGDFPVVLRVTDAHGDYALADATISVSRLNPPRYSLPAAYSGVRYEQQIPVDGGVPPYTFEVTPPEPYNTLPDGLSLSGSGLLSGIPGATGSYWFKVTVRDATGAALTRPVEFNTFPGPEALPLLPEPTSLPEASRHHLYTYGLQALLKFPDAGVEWTVKAGSVLPEGLQLKGSELNGVPKQAGDAEFTLVASNPGSSIEIPLRLRISPLALAPASIHSGSVGTPYRAVLTAVGGECPCGFLLAPASSLPPGLSLSSDGSLAGEPQIAGEYELKIIVSDSQGANLTKSLMLKIR